MDIGNVQLLIIVHIRMNSSVLLSGVMKYLHNSMNWVNEVSLFREGYF